jgi:uncharacterized low-complexity protein
MKPQNKRVGHLLGAGLVTTLTAGAVGATDNPFAIQDLAGAATIRVAEAATGQTDPKPQAGTGAEKMKEAGEMKCGAQMMMKKDAAAPDPKAAPGAEMKMDGAAPVAPAAPK